MRLTSACPAVVEASGFTADVFAVSDWIPLSDPASTPCCEQDSKHAGINTASAITRRNAFSDNFTNCLLGLYICLIGAGNIHCSCGEVLSKDLNTASSRAEGLNTVTPYITLRYSQFIIV
jgi:hypothetical protein